MKEKNKLSTFRTMNFEQFEDTPTHKHANFSYTNSVPDCQDLQCFHGMLEPSSPSQLL
jgi:hypothetical protein